MMTRDIFKMDSFLVIIGKLMSALRSKHIVTCVDHVVGVLARLEDLNNDAQRRTADKFISLHIQ